MAGLGVFAWIAIGVVGGLTVSRLMVGANDDALRGTAAGMIGAVLAALGVRLLGPAPELGNAALDTPVAALAGLLWLAWLTCVLTSGHDRGWQAEGAIAKAAWPLLARTVVADLEGDGPVTDVRVVARFDGASHRSSADRVQVVTEWLRGE